MKTKPSELSNISAFDNQLEQGDGIYERNGLLSCIVGPRGSGKTNQLTNLLYTPVSKGGLQKKFDRIYLVTPTRDPKLEELIQDCEQRGTYFDEFNDSIMEEIVDGIKAFKDTFKKKRKPKILVIMDDILASLPSSRQKRGPFVKFIFNHRHLSTDVIILAQRYKDLPTSLRSQLDIISMFSCRNMTEKKNFLEDFGVDEKIYDEVTSKPYGFLTVNVSRTGKPRLYNKYDEIVSDEE